MSVLPRSRLDAAFTLRCWRQHDDAGAGYGYRGAGRQLQRSLRDPQAVENPLLTHVDVRPGEHVEPVSAAESSYVLESERWMNDSVIANDLPEWCVQGGEEHIDTV